MSNNIDPGGGDSSIGTLDTTTTSATSSSCNHSAENSTKSATQHQLIDVTNKPMLNYDGTEMRDDKGRTVFRSQFLSTHPLRADCKERVGYGGKKFTYVSGDGVIRSMNAVFGHGGWGSQITMERMVQCERDDRGRWIIGYVASVRVSLRNGVSHEDCGSGDGINDSKVKAHEKAIKSAVTDAMKRAARHFGERLGNALYIKGNGIKTAPKTNKDALVELEKKDSLNLFGDQIALRALSLDSNSPKPCASNFVGNGEETPLRPRATVAQNQTEPSPVPSTRVRPPSTIGQPSIPPVSSRPISSTAAISHQALHMQPANRISGGNENSLGCNQFPKPPNLMPPPRPPYNQTVGGSSFSDDTPFHSSVPNVVHNPNKDNSRLFDMSAQKRTNIAAAGDTDGESNNCKKQKRNPYHRLSC